MEETISIKDIFKTLKKRWKLIMLLTLIAALISGTISYFLLTPVYQSSTQILVNQKQSENQLDSTQIRSNIDMINTYSVIIKSPAILEMVIDELELEQSVEQLSQKITINSQENSQVFSLTVQDSNPSQAVEIANTVSETFQKEIKDIMNVDNVSVLAKAEIKENPTPVKPNPVLNIAIAVVVGLMAGVGLAFLLEYMDNTIKDEDDIERLLELPILGSIQKITQVHYKG
ncbi:Capsular polysaccharide biosynthesis protein [Peribacillus simplex]|uniref:Capsular polysaccharide biosynthesis protein n=1 Tax=Peribacillus simplex TaxID=1478 RepID=A0A9X8WHQ1_9BACI|nr:Wzz/FepE/Etk N-terminal domain-containing protein [Peribacillus simplex]SIQ21878.1 Capsular polysaccharide biosynthesis protein [Peribacillus simplex]